MSSADDKINGGGGGGGEIQFGLRVQMSYVCVCFLSHTSGLSVLRRLEYDATAGILFPFYWNEAKQHLAQHMVEQ